MIFIDSNVLIDVLQRDPRWFSWSSNRLAESSALFVNPIVVAECARGFESLALLMREFQTLGIAVENLPVEAAFEAGRIFSRSRRTSSGRRKILSDFLIGAHADFSGATLLTRDASLYRTYFPQLTLITPETDNG